MAISMKAIITCDTCSDETEYCVSLSRSRDEAINKAKRDGWTSPYDKEILCPECSDLVDPVLPISPIE